VAPDVPFRERTERLRAIVNTSHDVAVSGADAAAAMASGADAGVTVAGVQPLVLVKTEAVASVDDIRAVHLDMTVRLHYEGTMVRADVATGYEVDKRSQSLLKVKDSDRKEFRTVRLERQEHDETLGAVWCVTPDGIEFKATPAMTDDEKRDIWAHRGQYGNMWGSVQHFGYTDKGAPRHAHIFGFRSADDMGVEAAAAVDGAADKDTKTGGV
jgi:ATP-dependent DNA ligase